MLVVVSFFYGNELRRTKRCVAATELRDCRADLCYQHYAPRGAKKSDRGVQTHLELLKLFIWKRLAPIELELVGVAIGV